MISVAHVYALFNIPLRGNHGSDAFWCDSSSVEDGATEVLDEPELGVILGYALELSDTVLSCSSLANSVAGSLEDNSEVHAENTSGGIVLNSEINMLIDTKSEVTYRI